MSNENVSLEVAIEVVLRNGPTFETIAGLCKMAVDAQRNEFNPDWDAMAVMVEEQQGMAAEIERLKDALNKSESRLHEVAVHCEQVERNRDAALLALRQAEQAQPVIEVRCFGDKRVFVTLLPPDQFKDGDKFYTGPIQRQPLIDSMREMLDVQGQHGNWNCDPYMHGMYNGMEYMLAMVENREPVFRDAPEKWLRDRKRQPLTDEQIATVYWGATGQSLRPQDNALAHKFARAIEAAHGIKGKA